MLRRVAAGRRLIMAAWLDDGDVRLYHGDAATVLRELPAGSAHCVVTSPPYFGLRDYGTATWTGGDPACDHLGAPKHNQAGFNERWNDRPPPQTTKQAEVREPFRDRCGKCGATRSDRQIGLEASPDAYVARLVGVFDEVRRVLRADGTCWVNLGDSYIGNGDRATGRNDTDRETPGGRGGSFRGGERRPISTEPSGLKAKDLAMMPARFALAMQARGWWLRSDIIWSKPNPMPESITDRPTSAHEHVFLFAASARYYYDADAVREPNQPDGRTATRVAPNDGAGVTSHANYAHRPGGERWPNAAGRNLRNVWTIPTESFAEAHFATFPQKLVEPCVLAGTSEHGVCAACGAQWRRVLSERGSGPVFAPLAITEAGALPDGGVGTHRNMGGRYQAWLDANPRSTTGWEPGCGCGAGVVPAVVLDPFAGSATTLLVARRLGRWSVGIDLNSEYLLIAKRRLQQLSLLGGSW